MVLREGDEGGGLNGSRCFRPPEDPELGGDFNDEDVAIVLFDEGLLPVLFPLLLVVVVVVGIPLAGDPERFAFRCCGGGAPPLPEVVVAPGVAVAVVGDVERLSFRCGPCCCWLWWLW